MAEYKLTDNGVFRVTDGAFIPDAPGNKDWKEYQRWLGQGNTPDPADVVDPWDEGRRRRNSLLANSDFTQLADAPLDSGEKAAWATYRQDLRDLPATYPDYNTVVWPTQP